MVHLRRVGWDDHDPDDVERSGVGVRVGLDDVLGDLDRTAVRTRVPGRLIDWGFRWDDEDTRTRHWWPQGITTSADAADEEEVGGRRLVVTSWYAKDPEGGNGGSRISIIDLATLRYRHVRVVTLATTVDGPEWRPLRVHAGGLVWWGPYLHIAGTHRGLFSARLSDIVRIDGPTGSEYVLPARFRYEATPSAGDDPMRYSFLSLDRSTNPPQLIAGEYGTRGRSHRLVHYPLDPDTFHLHAEEDGLSKPVTLSPDGVGRMQGATVVNSQFYVTTSFGPLFRGSLRAGKPGAFRRWRRAVPAGPEDITYWPSTDRLWSLTEYPRQRYVFCIDRARLA